MNITLTIEGTQLDNLQKVTAIYNGQMAGIVPGWVDVTPEEYWKDWNSRFLDGLVAPIKDNEQQLEEIQRVKRQNAENAEVFARRGIKL